MLIHRLRLYTLTVTIGSFGFFVHGMEKGNPVEGKAVSVLCQACHSENGGGKDNGDAESWPRLAGQNEAYLVKQLQDIKSGKRTALTMVGFATILDDKKTADVSAYYASLPIPNITPKVVSPEVLALGEKLAIRGDWSRYIPACQTCHGPNNMGVGQSFPSIANQQAGYIAKQLSNWKENKRNNDTNHIMATVAGRLTDEDIAAVSAYLSHSVSHVSNTTKTGVK